MDLLGQYSDSDAEEQQRIPAAEAPGPAPQPRTRNAPASSPQLCSSTVPPLSEQIQSQPEPPTSLFNPFATPDALRQSSHASASPSTGGGGSGKRAFTQVTGSSPIQDAPPKASRAATTPRGPKPAFNTALVPPQLRNGRANISTEDVEKIFTRGNLARRQQQQQQQE
ncbi:hypothetical protein VOLCADRAFT_96510 [Volvox carteri f. nagariensis]|uniref:Uncharacterized protein n=1 Tax=Volvox carteri f. nagariensis TaxID=3068 RepID=D8UAA9_VOLCA|nr:uncharacterized protein VOLCADRAFT_96510 [Volvox carteri f. nagariensis]EFJ43234.1 hypothetical protein VOLCADRAFT_96510 [Volvox carteri f. nagariensis]|eukprot:XP_002955594.1 hypothetical protein VOLCADRAFT_96510 [Volvox carteri f. nagariensis]